MNTAAFALDAIDRRILDALARDGRLPVAELARQVNLSKTPCQARLKRLEQTGYILGYRAVIDPKRLGLPYVAFVEVRLSDTRSAALAAFDAAVRTLPEIELCHMIASSFDYLLMVRTADMDSYRQVLGERISSLPFVAHTSSHVSMGAIKDDRDWAAAVD